MTKLANPLVDAPPKEVPLPNAPLVKVVAQVRFSAILMIEHQQFIAPFQESIRADYPSFEQQRTQNMVLGAEGFTPTDVRVTWRFTDPTGEWRVSLAPDFVALETSKYTSRDDFFARLAVVLEKVQVLQPTMVERIGVRYIDRVVGVSSEEIARLVRPELCGIASTPFADSAEHALTESVLRVGESRIIARWGVVPANRTVDVAAIDPVDQPSWLLDLDMFNTEHRPFEVKAVLEQARSYAQRIYTLFRWAVTDEFLVRYGAKL